MRDLRALRAGPVRVGDALAAGISYGRLRAGVAAGALTQLRKGAVVPASDWAEADLRQRRIWAAAAAVDAIPGSFASHETAALLWRLPDWGYHAGGDPPLTHVTRIGMSRTEGWIRIHGCDTPDHQTVVLDGLPVTSLVRTSIDLAACRSMRQALVFVDAAMRVRVAESHRGAGLRTAVLDDTVRLRLVREWDAGVAPFSRHRWVTRVRQAIQLADPAAETVLESLSRAAIIEAGLPRPRCGVPVTGDDGRTYWVDMLWDDHRLIGEADGHGKYASVSDLVQEKRRQEALEGRGFRFVRWGMPEVSPSATVMVDRIAKALASSLPSSLPSRGRHVS